MKTLFTNLMNLVKKEQAWREKDQAGTKLNSVISRQWTDNGPIMDREWIGKGVAALRYAASVLLLLCLGVRNAWGMI